MNNFITQFFSDHYISHGHCYLWQPGLVWLHVLSDLITALAYYLIPIVLLHFARKRQDMPFRGIILLFSLFILTCGTTHLLEVWTLWHPIYWVSGLVKAATAFISLLTAIELIPLIPKALALPSLAQSEAQYRLLFENNPNPMWIYDPDTLAFLAVNQAAVSHYGYSEAEFLSCTIADIRPKKDIPQLLEFLEKERGNFNSGEWRHCKRDGTVFDVEISRHDIQWSGQAAKFVLAKDVSTRKQAEAALAQSEAQYRLLFEANPNPMWIFDVNTFAFLAVNNAAVLKYGYSKDEFLAMTILDICPPSDVPIFKNQFAKVLSDFHTAEWRHCKKSGEVIDVEINCHAIVWENQSAKFILAKDISERKRLEAERQQAEAALKQLNQELDLKVQERTQELERSEMLLREREQTFRALVENTPDVIARFDRELHHLYVSPSVQQITGLPADAFIGKTNAELGMPDHLVTRWAEAVQFVFATAQPTEMEFNFPAADGTRYYQSKMVPEFALDGSVTSVLGTTRDITALKQTQAALQQSEEFFRRLFEDAPLGIGIAHLASNYLFSVNSMFCQMLGYSTEELTQLSFTDFTHPDDLEISVDLRNQLAAGISPDYQLEKRYIRKTGEIFWVSLATSIVRDPNGKPLYRLVMVKDITRRKQVEEALRQSEKRLSIALEGASAGMWDWNLKTNTGFWSEQNFRLLGYQPTNSATTFEQWRTAIHPNDQDRVVALLNRAIEEQTDISCEYQVLLPDGSTRWLYAKGKVDYDHAGTPKSTTGIQIDISDRKQVEIDLQLKAQQEQLLRLITQRVRQSLNLNDILATAVAEVRQTFQTDRALIFQLLPDEKGKVIKEAVSPELPSLGEGLWTDACLGPSSIQHYCLGQPRIVSNVALDEWGECLGKLLNQIGVKSKISAPIIQTREDGTTQVWGLLIIHACQYHRLWQAEEADFLQQISNQLAIAIQQSDLYQRVQTELSERQQIEAQLRTSLQEKEILLKEVHHRVKNNLQMISSLLSLQANSIENTEVLKPFIESQQRVKTMALIHEKLYQSENLAKIDFAEYVQTLVDGISQSYKSATSTISLRIEIPSIELGVDSAIACGLIINELVSNALKYAFPNHLSGEVKILFSSDNAQQHMLIVADNGMGLPTNLNFRQSPSLGLQLVCALTRKLRGTIALEQTNGTAFHIQF